MNLLCKIQQLNYHRGTIVTVRFIIFFTVFIILSTGLLHSQSYFVDYSNGDDSNNGLTTSTPFKHCPGDINATGTAANTNLTAGDIVLFKGGVEYKSQILIPESGNSNDYIVFKGDGNWGTGRAIFNMEFTRDYAFDGGYNDYIEIQGFEFLRYSSSGDNVIETGSGAHYWKIDNCTFAYINNWNIPSSHPDNPPLDLNGNEYFWITNCEFFASGYQIIRLTAAENIWIQNCNFGGIDRHPDSTGWFTVAIKPKSICKNIYIQDNVFHDGWQYGGDQNPEINHSPDWIHIYGGGVSDPGPEDIWIERNKFYIDHQFNTGSGTGTMSVSTMTKRVRIRNNLFINSCQWWGFNVGISNGADYVWIENNTFVDRDYTTNSRSSNTCNLKLYSNNKTNGGAGDSVWIYNNVFYNEDDKSTSCTIYLYGSGGWNGLSDYNAFYSDDVSSLMWEESYGFGGASFSEWQSLGWDANSVIISDSEIFTDFPVNPENSGSGDYSLNPTYANELIDNGIPRSGYNDSYDGTARPQGNGWDIGAYELSDRSDITPPEVTGATLMDSVTLVVNFSEAVEETSAGNINNYSISPYIHIFNATLSGSNVTLSTGEHTPGIYTVTVENVEDLAGNLISDTANTASYMYDGSQITMVKLPVVEAIASSVPQPLHSPDKVLDGLGAFGGDPDSRWAGYPNPEWLQFELGSVIPVGMTRLSFYNWNGGCIYNYSINVSVNGVSWTEVVPSTFSTNEEWTVDQFTMTEARYIRVNFHSQNQNNWAGLWEGEIWGDGTTSGEETNEENLPTDFVLHQNYPNPFNPSTTIRFDLPVSSKISLKIYNSIGQEVANLAEENLGTGIHEYEFNAKRLPSGIYFYTVIAKDFVQTKKMILLK